MKLAAASFVIFFAAVIGVTLLADHHGKSSQSKSETATVAITDHGFQPATLTVREGTKITWTNSGVHLHQVASNPFPTDNGLPGLNSEILNNAQTYSFVASKTGTYGYHDQLKPTMNGTIIVEKQ